MQFAEMSAWLEKDTDDTIPAASPTSYIDKPSTSSTRSIKDNFEYFTPLVDESSRIRCTHPRCKSTFGHKRCKA